MSRKRKLTPEQKQALKAKIDLRTIETMIEMKERRQSFRNEAAEIAHILVLAMLWKELGLMNRSRIITPN